MATIATQDTLLRWHRQLVARKWTSGTTTRDVPLRWYGEYLWQADWPADVPASAGYRVCATDAAGLSACAEGRP